MADSLNCAGEIDQNKLDNIAIRIDHSPQMARLIKDYTQTLQQLFYIIPEERQEVIFELDSQITQMQALTLEAAYRCGRMEGYCRAVQAEGKLKEERLPYVVKEREAG